MARRPRLNVSGIPQHVIQRGNNRQAIFFTDADYRFYLDCLGDAVRKYGCLVHAYVLMTNHVHLLATPHSSGALSHVMQHLGRRYVQYINYTYRRSGTLWEGRFKANLVEAERYFWTCCRYIELNPVRAQMVIKPEDYLWSSYRHNALGVPDSLVSAHQQYMALGNTAIERRAAYQALFRSSLDDLDLDRIRRAANKGWPLGDDRFTNEIEVALGRAAWPPKRGRPPKSRDGAACVVPCDEMSLCPRNSVLMGDPAWRVF